MTRWWATRLCSPTLPWPTSRSPAFSPAASTRCYAWVRPPIQRYVVVDYKTNRLGGDDLTLGHYAQGPMVAAMCQAHYPLQALLYCVALHRFLAARLAGYDPGRHLGGVLYLFVRGMGGAATTARPPVCSPGSLRCR